MGAWEELDTEISVDVDTSELEELLNTSDKYGIFDPLKKSVENLITNVHDGSKEAMEDIARRNKSFQQQIIAVSCKNPSGMLQSSIQAKKQHLFNKKQHHNLQNCKRNMVTIVK